MERITDVLDENDNIINSSTLDEAHAKGLLHRSIHILVADDSGRVFIRRRPGDRLVYPNLWTSSVGTHVLSGMNPDIVAQTALKDFLGLDTPVRYIGEQHVHDEFENEMINIYVCRANSVTDLNPNESSEGEFMTPEQIQGLGEENKTTPHLISALNAYLDAQI